MAKKRAPTSLKSKKSSAPIDTEMDSLMGAMPTPPAAEPLVVRDVLAQVHQRTLGVMVNLLLVCAMVFCVVSLTWGTDVIVSAALCGLALVAVGLKITYQRGPFKALPLLLVLTIVGYSVAGVVACGTVRSVPVLGFAMAITAGGFFLARNALIKVVAVILFWLALLIYAENAQLLPKASPNVGWDNWMMFALAFITFALQAYFSRSMVTRVLTAQTQQLQEAQASAQSAATTAHDLQTANDHLTSLFRHGPEAIAVTEGPERICVDVNHAFEQMFGIPRDTVLGKSSAELNFWAIPSDRPPYLEKLAREGRVAGFETQGRKSNGHFFDMKVSSTQIKGSNPLIVVEQMTDISAEVKSRREVSQSVERFSQAFHLSPVPLTLTRLSDGKYLEVNAANAHILGVNANTLLNSETSAKAVWASDEAYAHFVATLRLQRHIQAYDASMKHANGEVMVCRIWAEVVTLSGVDCVLSSTLNMTDEKRREALLLDIARGFSGQTGVAFLQSLAEHLAQALTADWVTVGELENMNEPIIAQVNTLALVRYGKSLESQQFPLQSSPSEKTLLSNELYTYNEHMAELFPRDRMLKAERIEAFAGKALRDANGNPVGVLNVMWRTPRTPSAEEDALLHMFADRANAELLRIRRDREITHLSESLELRVEARTAQLEAANAELESFAYSVSHDLRSPLRAIDGFTRILAEKLEGRISAEEYALFDRVVRSAGRMNELITDLIGLAQINQGPLNLETVDISMMASDVMADLQQSQPNRVAHIEIEPHVMVLADSRLARIVLENVLGNAWKYTQHRQSTEIAFGAKSGRLGNLGSSGPWPLIFVKDNGAGFDMAYADKLFKPFHRLHHDKEFEGSGIGLATVHRILERHGGLIQGMGKRGMGAEFRFCFAPPEDFVSTTNISAF